MQEVLERGVEEAGVPGVDRQRQRPLLVEEVGGKGGEGEDRRVEGHAEQHDEPERRTELGDVGEDDLVPRLAVLELQHPPAVAVHEVVDDVAGEAQHAKARRGPERRLPAPAGGHQLLGVEREQRSQPRDRQRDAEGERELLAAEPPGEDRVLRHDERLGAGAEDEASDAGHGDRRREGDDRRADHDQRGEEEARDARPDLVDQHAPDEDGEDRGDAVDRVERADRLARRLPGLDEVRREGPDRVVGEVAAERQQPGVDQDREAERRSGGMEERERVVVHAGGRAVAHQKPRCGKAVVAGRSRSGVKAVGARRPAAARGRTKPAPARGRRGPRRTSRRRRGGRATRP